MTARPDPPASSEQQQKSRSTAPAESDRRPGLITAIVIAGVGALLAGLAPATGVVTSQVSPAFVSWPLLLVLAAVPPGLATAFLRSGKSGLAAGMLIAPAILAPGRLILDVQLVLDAGDAARPELLLPSSLDPLAPSTGTWLLLAGHVGTCVAGIVAAMTSGDRGSAAPAFGSSETETGPSSGVRRQGLLAFVLCAAVVAGVGALMAPLTSDDPYLIPRAAVDSPILVLIGSVLVALGVPTAGGIAASSVDPEFARGGLLGLAAAVASLAVPSLVAATVVPELHYAAGAVFGLVAVLALLALAVPAGRAGRAEMSDDLRLPAGARLHTASGVLAVLAGVLAVVGAIAPDLWVPEWLGDPSTYPARMLWPAGAVLVVLGIALLLPRTTAWVRPTLVVAWAVLPLTGAAVLDSVFTTLQVAGTRAGFGAWAAGCAAVVGIAAAIVAAVAGAVERDDVDLTEVSSRRALIGPVVLAVLLAGGAFSFPVVTGPDYTPPGLFAGFSTTSWGLVVALLSIVAGAVLAPMSRPSRAAGLLCGAALVMLVRVLELPLTEARVAGSGPGLGLWFGLAGIVVLLVAAAVSAFRPAPARSL